MFFNPYFKVGALHNAGLAFLGPQVVGTNPNNQTIAELVGDYISFISVPGGGIHLSQG